MGGLGLQPSLPGRCVLTIVYRGQPPLSTDNRITSSGTFAGPSLTHDGRTATVGLRPSSRLATLSQIGLSADNENEARSQKDMARSSLQPSLHDQLRQAMTLSGWSLNELGRRSGVDPGRLSRYMRKERDLTFDAVDRLCRALGLHLTAPVGEASSAATATPATQGPTESTAQTVQETDQAPEQPPKTKRRGKR